MWITESQIICSVRVTAAVKWILARVTAGDLCSVEILGNPIIRGQFLVSLVSAKVVANAVNSAYMPDYPITCVGLRK